jgi:hypothetical protein
MAIGHFYFALTQKHIRSTSKARAIASKLLTIDNEPFQLKGNRLGLEI